jgi:hypothetical protein
MVTSHQTIFLLRQRTADEREQYAKASTRIRDSTTAIWKLHNQPPHAQRQRHVADYHARARVEFYEALATLLVRSPEESLRVLACASPEATPSAPVIIMVTQPRHIWDEEHRRDSFSRPLCGDSTPSSCHHVVHQSGGDFARLVEGTMYVLSLTY